MWPKHPTAIRPSGVDDHASVAQVVSYQEPALRTPAGQQRPDTHRVIVGVGDEPFTVRREGDAYHIVLVLGDDVGVVIVERPQGILSEVASDEPTPGRIEGHAGGALAVAPPKDERLGGRGRPEVPDPCGGEPELASKENDLAPVRGEGEARIVHVLCRENPDRAG